MMRRERFAPDDPREWLSYSRSDLVMARADVPGVYPEDLCFHAQQAAEKAVKGLLIMHGVGFPFVHDLAILVALVEEAGEAIPEAVRLAGRLTNYAALTRYPGMMKQASEQDLAEAVNVAEAVVRWVEERIQARACSH